MSTIVLVTVPGDPGEALVALTKAVAPLRGHLEVMGSPGPEDPASEPMAAAGVLLLRHCARPADRGFTLQSARVWLDRAEGLGIEPAVSAGRGPATE